MNSTQDDDIFGLDRTLFAAITACVVVVLIGVAFVLCLRVFKKSHPRHSWVLPSFRSSAGSSKLTPIVLRQRRSENPTTDGTTLQRGSLNEMEIEVESINRPGSQSRSRSLQKTFSLMNRSKYLDNKRHTSVERTNKRRPSSSNVPPSLIEIKDSTANATTSSRSGFYASGRLRIASAFGFSLSEELKSVRGSVKARRHVSNLSKQGDPRPVASGRIQVESVELDEKK